MEIAEALTFDDVLLVPAASSVLPARANTSTRLTKSITLNIPLISAAMDTVTESGLAIAMAQLGGIGVIHKNFTPGQQAQEVRRVKKFESGMVINPVTIFSDQTLGDALRLREQNRIVDTAHGHSKGVLDTISRIKRHSNHAQVVGGNIATPDAARALIDAGADAVKVGIGPGSICTTRVVAGVGVPQLSAVMETAEATRKAGVPIIADGGIKFSGDIAKAIAAGADCVMFGSLLAGTEETPGEVILYQGRTYKDYRGMGSLGAMARGSADRYFQEEVRDSMKLVPEGVEGRVAYKGPAAAVVHQLVGGLKAAMGYTGNASVAEMQKNCKFRRITGAGMRESHVHDVIVTREPPNYRVNNT